MSSKTKHNGEVRDSYLEMIRKFPLTSIRDNRHLKSAQDVLDAMFAREPLDNGEEEYLEALSDLIAHYEARNVHIGVPTDVAVLEHLMQSKGVSQSELAKETGIPKSTISEILAKKRTMTRSQIAHFAEFFGVDQGAFQYSSETNE